MTSVHFLNVLEMCPVSPIFVTFALHMRCATFSTSSRFSIFSVFLRHTYSAGIEQTIGEKVYLLLKVLISIFVVVVVVVVVDLVAVLFVTHTVTVIITGLVKIMLTLMDYFK